MIESVAPGTGSMVMMAGPAITIGLGNSAVTGAGAVLKRLIEATKAFPKIGVGVGVGRGDGVGVGVGGQGVGVQGLGEQVGVQAGVGVGVGVGVGAGGNMPATITPRCPVSMSCVKFLIVKNTPSLT